MIEINVLDKNFKNIDRMSVSVDFSPSSINAPVVHQVITALLSNRRAGTASTKTRAFVRGGGAKPYKQKGTGRARQGSTRSPLLVGGATVFGPTPRSFEKKINKSMMTVALRSIVADKYLAGKLIVIDKIESDGKTKSLAKSLLDANLSSTLIVFSGNNDMVKRAAKNLPNVKALPVGGANIYDAVKYETLLIDRDSFDYVVERIS